MPCTHLHKKTMLGMVQKKRKRYSCHHGWTFCDHYDQDTAWHNTSYRMLIPCTYNAMPCNAFHFMQMLIHFNKNNKMNEHSKNDKLFKLHYILRELMEKVWLAWIAGENIPIDKTMIKNCRCAIICTMHIREANQNWTKIFVVCCAYIADLLCFEVYIGDNTMDANTALRVVTRLITEAGMMSCHGQTSRHTIDIHQVSCNHFLCEQMVLLWPIDKKDW